MDAQWSDELTEFIAESSKDHFIDRYNRSIVMDGLAAILSKPGARYIDVGCASGYLLEEVVERFPQAIVTGADYFTGGFKECQKRLPNVPLLQIDLTKTGLPSDQYDAMSALNVLEHIQDDGSALKEIHRLLKPGGRVAITVPAGPHLYDFYDEVHTHERRYARKELRDKIAASGLSLLRMNYFGAAIYPAFYLQKRWNQFRHGHRPLAEKKALAHRLMTQGRRSPLMEKLHSWEMLAGKKVDFPFGVRLYALAGKSV